MLAHILDAVIIFYGEHTIFFDQLIARAQAVFHDEQRLLVAVIKLIEQVTEPFRIDLPSPLGRGQIRVGHARDDVSCRLGMRIGIRTAASAHIVAERDEIHAVLQNLLIPFLHLDLDAIFFEIAVQILRISTSGLHIGKVQVVAVLLHVSDHIVRIRRKRIARYADHHAADLVVRIDLMRHLGDQRAGDQLMMDRLIQSAF